MNNYLNDDINNDNFNNDNIKNNDDNDIWGEGATVFNKCISGDKLPKNTHTLVELPPAPPNMHGNFHFMKISTLDLIILQYKNFNAWSDTII